ncbi:MAG: RNA polymerase sigma factor [Opitutaceae bacterium]|jgi:RNA polymerase sigma-70 factor (ECF subfamily)
MPTRNLEQDRWFAEQLQPHEPVLRAWLHSRFPSASDIDDIVQEAFMRVLQAHASVPMEAPKAFLFTTARNLVLDRLRHQRVERIDSLMEIDELPVMDDNADIPETVARTQELEILTRAIQSLPARCRQVLTLRKIYGMSQKEIAVELGIAEHTVEAQAAIGLRKCVEYFQRYNRQLPPHT